MLKHIWYYINRWNKQKISPTILSKISKSSYAVILGATGSIGGEYARTLARSGLNLLLIARNRQKLDALIDDLRSGEERNNGDFQYLVMDFIQASQIHQNMKSLLDKVHHIDISLLINAAGYGMAGLLTDISTDMIEDMISVNITYPTCIMNTILPKITNNGGMINISSGLSKLGKTPFNSIYTSTKCYQSQLSTTLESELPANISTLLVTPLFVKSPLIEGIKYPKYLEITPEQLVLDSFSKLGWVEETAGSWRHCFAIWVLRAGPAKWRERVVRRWGSLAAQRVIRYLVAKGRRREKYI